MMNDLEIAQAANMRPIVEVAAEMGLSEDEIDLFGKYKAKIHLSVLERLKGSRDGKLIVITAITPTPLGEGKTVTSVGLAEAMRKIGKKVVLTLREPSMGPVFGIKGGAAGGGYAQVVPMEELNLHFTGDTHAVGAAHNLLTAMVDAAIYHGNRLNIDPSSVTWPRVLDISDRTLRNVVIGLGGRTNGIPRETGYCITAASEVMAILALSKGLKDLRERLGRVVVGYTYDGKPVTAEDLKAAGAMTVLLKEAIKPNLIQTLEGGPCIMHAGPFANVAHGNNSVLADMIALKLGDYVVTESGFGADMGMEKFFNIKCRQSGLKPNCVVITCTLRALKMHGGVGNVRPGRQLPKELMEENLPALVSGSANLIKHIGNAKRFGVPVVVSINRFTGDRDNEIDVVRKIATDAGAETAVPIEVWTRGGEGGVQLAEAVVKACEKPSKLKLLYRDEDSIKKKIEAIAVKMYGADGVDYDQAAERKIRQFTELGYNRLPLCMAKTQLSLSHDPDLKGAPKGFRVPVRDILASVGAGFLYPLLGTMMTMPGLPSHPAAMEIDIDDNGNTVGLF